MYAHVRIYDHIYIYMYTAHIIQITIFTTHPSLFPSTIWIPKAHLALASALIQKGVKVGGSMIGKGRYLAWWILMKEDPQKVGIFLLVLFIFPWRNVIQLWVCWVEMGQFLREISSGWENMFSRSKIDDEGGLPETLQLVPSPSFIMKMNHWTA